MLIHFPIVDMLSHWPQLMTNTFTTTEPSWSLSILHTEVNRDDHGDFNEQASIPDCYSKAQAEERRAKLARLSKIDGAKSCPSIKPRGSFHASYGTEQTPVILPLLGQYLVSKTRRPLLGFLVNNKQSLSFRTPVLHPSQHESTTAMLW